MTRPLDQTAPIILFGGGPGFGLPEVSPYVTKTLVQLRMAGLEFVFETARPEDSPKGQIPFIEATRAVLQHAEGATDDEVRGLLRRARDVALSQGALGSAAWVARRAASVGVDQL